jgi:hypothetical protein
VLQLLLHNRRQPPIAFAKIHRVAVQVDVGH